MRSDVMGFFFAEVQSFLFYIVAMRDTELHHHHVFTCIYFFLTCMCFHFKYLLILRMCHDKIIFHIIFSARGTAPCICCTSHHLLNLTEMRL